MTTPVANMTTEAALAILGATTDLLSNDEKRQLDTEGYLVIENVLTVDDIAKIGARLDALLDAEGEDAGKEVHQEAGTDRLANLVDKGAVFEIFYTHPKFVAAAAYILSGDIKFSALTARFAKPGEGAQILHRDYGTVKVPGVWEAVNSIWLLDDYTVENGATRVVPGSHLWPTPPPSEEAGSPLVSDEDSQAAENDLRDPVNKHPEQRLVVQKAGTVVVFNCNLWHSGTLNQTQQRRRGVYSSWVRADKAQLENAAASLSAKTVASLSPALRHLMDV